MIRIKKNLLVVYNKKYLEFLNPNPKLLGFRKREKVPKMDKLYSKKKETPPCFDSGHHVKRIFVRMLDLFFFFFDIKDRSISFLYYLYSS